MPSSLTFKKDDFVKIVATNGNYRYGYIARTSEAGFHIEVCMHEEGESMLEYESLSGGQQSIDLAQLSEAEKRLLPLLALACPTGDIASKLNISPSTVRSQVHMLKIKLGVTERDQLCVLAQALAKGL